MSKANLHWFRRTVLSSIIIVAVSSLTIACMRSANRDANSPPAGPSGQTVSGTVIYGADNRRDLFDEPNASLRRVADSTVALIKNTEITRPGDGTVSIRTANFGQRYYLCAGERFREQETAAFCSGFLVASDLIVTAGHCVTSLLNCQETSFVFGFAYRVPLVTPNRVPATDVYSCRELLHSQADGGGADYAVIRLDRPVQGHVPLSLRRSGSPSPGDDLTVLGHPSGLPLKISGGAKVRSVNAAGYLVANLDTYGGNSGSAVVSDRTHDVEGILVRGERDFELKDENGLCYASNVCTEDGCRGEDVTLISETLKHIK